MSGGSVRGSVRDGIGLRAETDRLSRSLRRLESDDILLSDERGLYLRAADGHYWRLSVSNAGALTTTLIGPEL